jgi:hypothetical protein
MSAEPQSYAHHRRIVPGFHVVAFFLLIVYFSWTVYRLVTEPSVERLMNLVPVAAIGLMFWYMRVFPLTVQNRVIRLEERLRLERLLPAALKGEVGRLRLSQLIALRFASDEELPELAATVLRGDLDGPDEIKRKIQSWRVDHLRA